jgi:F0F1-type ATP synthase gamma subunit
MKLVLEMKMKKYQEQVPNLCPYIENKQRKEREILERDVEEKSLERERERQRERER